MPLFDGKTLNGWTLLGKKGPGYLVQDGKLICPPGGGGNLLSEKEYTDFILRFEFKLEEGSNNGLAIRYPGTGDPAYAGVELQVLDDSAEKYGKLKPYQYHGNSCQLRNTMKSGSSGSP